MTIQQVYLKIGPAIGLPGNFDGSPAALSALSDSQKSALALETARFVSANPAEFSAFQVDRARKILDSGAYVFQQTRDPSAIDFAADFVRAYGKTAGEFVEGAAGVAGRSVKAVGINPGAMLTIVAVVAVLYFGAPFVVPQLRKALQSKP